MPPVGAACWGRGRRHAWPLMEQENMENAQSSCRILASNTELGQFRDIRKLFVRLGDTTYFI